MNKLVIKLNEDGSIYQYAPDFKIMRGSYRNVLINIEVPHSLLIDPVNDTDENETKTGNNVRVGGIITTSTGKHLQTKRYEFKRVKDFLREGIEYRLYQRKMPKEFTMWDTLDDREEAQSGSLLLVINVVNWVINELNAKIEEVSASPSFRLDIQPSAFLSEAEEIQEPSDFDLLQSQVQDHDKEIDELKKDLYGEGGETLGEFLTSRLKAGWKILLKKENGQVKISVDTIKAREVPIDIVGDLPAQNVQKAIEEIWNRVDFKFVDSITGEDDYLVDNTDSHNPVIKHDKSKIDKASIADDLTTSDNTKVLAASQGVVLKAEIERTNTGIETETDARTKADTSLQDKITTEESTRESEDANLKAMIDNLETLKASKTEMSAAISEAIETVINSAPDAFDTLKEIADWIKNDEEGTSALVLRVGEIEKKNQAQDQALTEETIARENVEAQIEGRIRTEITARESADADLQNKIDAETTARENAVSGLTDLKLDDVQIEGGTNNGTIKLIKKINSKSTTTDNIAITGLKSAAYTDSGLYATAEQGKRADQSINELTANELIRDAVDEAKGQLQTKIDEVSLIANRAVSFEEQSLSEQQKAQARSNIGAGASTFSGSYNDLGQRPIVNTNNSESLEPNKEEVIQGTFNLHKISKTGKLADVITDNEHETISAVEKTQIETNKAGVEANKSAIKNNETDIEALKGRMNTAEDDIAAVQSDIEQAETDINTIEGKIPTQASASNQLADKNFVNSSINNVAAYPITKNAAGDPFSTKAELIGATTFYSGGALRTPTRNDYCTVLKDESQEKDPLGNYPTTRYTYQGSQWELSFIINNTTFTSGQIAALNSGITAEQNAQITTNKNELGKKANQTDLTTLSSKVSAAEEKNANQDKELSTLKTTMGDLQKADAQNVKITGDQSIAGTKTFTSPIYVTSIYLA